MSFSRKPIQPPREDLRDIQRAVTELCRRVSEIQPLESSTVGIAHSGSGGMIMKVKPSQSASSDLPVWRP